MPVAGQISDSRVLQPRVGMKRRFSVRHLLRAYQKLARSYLERSVKPQEQVDWFRFLFT
jgi:hypothetical protein